MDIPITRKKTLPTFRYLVTAIVVLIAGLASYYLWFLSQAELSIDAQTLVFDEVKRGSFTVSVRGTGVLVPDNIEWLSAGVEGTLIQRAVKPGHEVKKGDIIVKLSNPRLQQQLTEAQWELAALTAELTATRVAQESAQQQQNANVLNARLDYENSQMEFHARADLVATGAVSRLDYERTRLAMNQFKQRLSAHQQQAEKIAESLVAQRLAQEARLNQGKQRIAIIQQQVDDLHIKATMDSILMELPLTLGQRIGLGDKVAKLAQKGSLLAELRVPELQIREVAVGQRVVIDTRNNKFEGRVARVDPAVINGNVQVDVAFVGDLPSDARPDLSVEGEIKIAEIADTLYVSRPLFAQSQSATVLFKLSSNGRFVERVLARVGQGSVDQIQIIEGLTPGDSIVISDPTRFANLHKFRLQ